MDYSLFDTEKILLPLKGQLLDVQGPGGIGNQVPGRTQSGSTEQTQRTTQPSVSAQTVEVPEPELSEEEQAQLQKDRVPDTTSDPNSDPIQRVAVQQARDRGELLQRVLGDSYQQHVEAAGREGAQSADDYARVLFEQGGDSSRDMARRIQDALSVLPPEEGEAREFLLGVLEGLQTRLGLDGGTTMQSASVQQLQEKQGEVTQLTNQWQGALTEIVGADVVATLSRYGFQGTTAMNNLEQAVTAKYADAIQALQAELAQARADGNTTRVQQLESELSSLEGQRDVELGQARLLTRLLGKAEQVMRTGNLEQINNFLNALQQPRPELGGDTLLSRIQQADSVQELEQLELIADQLVGAEATTASAQSTAGQAAAPTTAMGAQSAGATAQSAGDQPVEAVEAVQGAEAVEMEEGGPEGPAPDFDVETMSRDDHEATAVDWSNLSQVEIGMQIASAGLRTSAMSGMFRARSRTRKMEKALQQMIAAIEAGNTDAIAFAMILISRQAKEDLRRAATVVVKSMMYYEKQQRAVNDQLASLNPETDSAYASKMQTLSNEMNMFATNRQAAVSVLRDINATSDELENATKSILDVRGSHIRALARWTA